VNMTKFRTYKIALTPQTKPRRGEGLRHLPPNLFTGPFFKKSRHLGFGVFIDIWSMEQSLESGLDCGRKNVPVKKTKFSHSHVVEYFTAAKALDALLNDSPWAKAGQQWYTSMFDKFIPYFTRCYRYIPLEEYIRYPVYPVLIEHFLIPLPSIFDSMI
jgi:hypothetical protein